MMSSSLLLLLLLLLTAVTQAVSQPTDPTELCHYWGESQQGEVSVLEGEAASLACPLFFHPNVYNYSSTQSAGHTLVWYHVPEDGDLEQPIRDSSRLSRDREKLWLLPAVTTDTGQYICMLRNRSSCSKISVRLNVLDPDQVALSAVCAQPVAVAPTQLVVYMQEGAVLNCPDLQDAAKMADTPPTVSWSHLRSTLSPCVNDQFWEDRERRGASLEIHIMKVRYVGLYICRVHFLRRGRNLTFSRSINVTTVYPRPLPKIPSILHPQPDQVITVRTDSAVRLVCRGMFPYLDSPWEIWWTVDGLTLDKLEDRHRFSTHTRQLKYDYGDRTEQSELLIQDFQPEDLKREFNCSVKNDRGFQTCRARLEEEVSLPSVELGCGLGVTLVLMLLLFVIYHVFWLELLLLYRSWFGTDERHTDDKEYDVYISYARNSEDEHFVLSTLRSVLENELGYSVCIFDRDSLPGGTITDETLSFVARSRRLLVVLGPGYGCRGSQALLELKAGIDAMARGGHLRIILLLRRPLRRQAWVRELRRARLALVLLRWQGEASQDLSSRFWKRLRLELPLRRVEPGTATEAELRRLQSQNSSSSQTGLLAYEA